MRSATTGFVTFGEVLPEVGMERSRAPAGLLAADAFTGDAFLVTGAGVGGVGLGVETLRLPQFGQQRPHVGVVGVHQDVVGAEHVAALLSGSERRAVDE